MKFTILNIELGSCFQVNASDVKGQHPTGPSNWRINTLSIPACISKRLLKILLNFTSKALKRQCQRLLAATSKSEIMPVKPKYRKWMNILTGARSMRGV